MSIDLNVCIAPEVAAQELRKGISKTFTELTENPAPSFLMWTMENGERTLMDDKQIIVCDSLIVVEALGLDAQIVLTIAPSFEKDGMLDCAISAEYSRSAVEFTLAASCAVWLSRRFKMQIRDEWQFWTDTAEIEPDDLANKIQVKGIRDLTEACRTLVGMRVESE